MSQSTSSYRRAINELGRNGYSIAITRGGHIRITHPQMAGCVIGSFSPSARGTLTKVRADIKRGHRAYQLAKESTACAGSSDLSA
jgi:predicted RNA binding protein YcfA (HicA-like mRNA interferase family)